MGLQTFPLKSGHVQALLDIWREAKSHSSEGLLVAAVWTSEGVDSVLREGLSRGSFEGPKLVGFILIRGVGEDLEILQLGTLKEFRRRGVMKALISEILSRTRPGTKVFLEVHERNVGARHLYEDSGFREIGRRPGYYADGGSSLTYGYDILESS